MKHPCPIDSQISEPQARYDREPKLTPAQEPKSATQKGEERGEGSQNLPPDTSEHRGPVLA